RRAARRARRRAAVRADRYGAGLAGPDAGRDRARRDRAAAGAGLARLLRRRHGRVLRSGHRVRGDPLLRAPRLHPAGRWRGTSRRRGVPAVAARNSGRGKRRGRAATRPAVPRARRARVAGAHRRAAAGLRLPGQVRPEGDDLRRGDRHPRDGHRRGPGDADHHGAGRDDRERRGRLGLGGLFGVRRLRVYRVLGIFRVVRFFGVVGFFGFGRLQFDRVHPADRASVQAAGLGAERRERPGHRRDRADRGAGTHGAGRGHRHHRGRHQLRHRGERARPAEAGPGHAGHLGERVRPGNPGHLRCARGRRPCGGERLMALHITGHITGRIAGPVIELRGLARTYPGPPPVPALRPADLVIEAGDYVAVTGPSGSGKSTLLHLLGLLDAPTEGSYLLDGLDTSALRDQDRSALRGRRIGFVFQAFHLLPYRTALENVLLAGLYNQTSRGDRVRAAAGALDAVGLAHRLDALPTTLSGGEYQRVAIARALVNRPSLLLCD